MGRKSSKHAARADERSDAASDLEPEVLQELQPVRGGPDDPISGKHNDGGGRSPSVDDGSEQSHPCPTRNARTKPNRRYSSDSDGLRVRIAQHPSSPVAIDLETYQRQAATEEIAGSDTFSRFLSKLFINGECWDWTAGIGSEGYGSFKVAGKSWSAPGWIAQKLWDVPKNYEPDHLCRRRICVRPQHLDVVTHRENTRRGSGWAGVNARKTHCPAGHAYDTTPLQPGAALRGHRVCQPCLTARVKAWRRAHGVVEGQGKGRRRRSMNPNLPISAVNL